MKLPTSAILALLVAGAAHAQTVSEPAASGPRGSSQIESGETRYDEVGYAMIGALPGMRAASAALAPGEFAEVTALDSGRTIVVVIAAGGDSGGRLIALSAAAAAALGIGEGSAGVRVRRVAATPQDAAQLMNGQPASNRADAPPVLLVPLRKKLTALAGPVTRAPAKRPPVRPAGPVSPPVVMDMPKPAAPSPTATGSYLVQIATVSDAGRARALATKVDGRVTPSGTLFRVQTGPFADRAAAVRGQAAAVKLGYRDAHIIRNSK